MTTKRMRLSIIADVTALLLLGIVGLNAHSHFGSSPHKCVHHLVQHEEKIRSHQKYSRTGPIELRSSHKGNKRRNTETAPIRVTFDKSDLTRNTDEKRRIYIEKVLDKAEEYMEALLKVFPVEGPLYVSRRCTATWDSGPNKDVCARVDDDSTLRCGSTTNIPSDHLAELRVVDTEGNDYTLPAGQGVPETDLLVYVTASAFDEICLRSQQENGDEDTDAGALAYANSCQRDQRDRPVVAYINFCTNKVDADPPDEPEDADVKLALHELCCPSPAREVAVEALVRSGGSLWVLWNVADISAGFSDAIWHEQAPDGGLHRTHILGMSQSSYPFWREEDGTPRTVRCPDNPLCTENSRAGDPPLRGNPPAYLADDTTLRRIGTESGAREAIVTPTVQSVVREHFNCSRLEGAELEDQGGEGTELSHWEKRIFFSEFMTGSTQSGSQSVVSLLTLALLQDTGWYEVEFQAPVAGTLEWGLNGGCSFAQDACPAVGCSEGGVLDSEKDVCAFDRSAIGYCAIDPLMDGCTVVLPYVDQECQSEEDVKIRVKCDGADCLGSHFGEGSACFESSLKLDGFNAPYDSTVSCYRHRCVEVGGEDVLEVRTPDFRWQRCAPGELLESEGYGGRILCPDTGQLCGKFTGPALPSGKTLIPLNLDDGNTNEPLGFIAEASALDWALYGGAAAGGLGALCLCYSIYRWRKRSTSGMAKRLGLRRKDRWAGQNGQAGEARTASEMVFGDEARAGARRTSAELEYERAMRNGGGEGRAESMDFAGRAGELSLADLEPVNGGRVPHVDGGVAQVERKGGCVVM